MIICRLNSGTFWGLKNMIEISLFIDKEFDYRLKRKVVPRLGETIIVNHRTLKVVDVIHEWDGDGAEFVQVNTVKVKNI